MAVRLPRHETGASGIVRVAELPKSIVKKLRKKGVVHPGTVGEPRRAGSATTRRAKKARAAGGRKANGQFKKGHHSAGIARSGHHAPHPGDHEARLRSLEKSRHEMREEINGTAHVVHALGSAMKHAGFLGPGRGMVRRG